MGMVNLAVACVGRAGLNTWAAFYGSDAYAVVAIHHDMIGTTPDILFPHYWGRGPAQKLAAGVRAAVDQTARPTR